jgi:glycosyltransferase involved in cell wall biosynthesis
VAEQTYSNLHVVIVDDGSTDKTTAIAAEFCRRDPRFELISTANAGVSAARNIGIDSATGKYIGFVDADDRLYPDSIEILVTALICNTADVAIGQALCSRRFESVARPTYKPVVMDYNEAMKRALYQRYILNSPCGMIMRRSLLGDDIRFNTATRYEDLDAFYRFYEHATSIVYLPQMVYFYRQSDTSFMHRWSQQRLDALDVTDRIVDFMTHRYPDLIPAALDRRFSAHFNMLLLLYHFGVDNTEAINRCLRVVKEGRRRALTDPNVRIKNKLGAIASYAGTGVLRMLARHYF